MIPSTRGTIAESVIFGSLAYVCGRHPLGKDFLTIWRLVGAAVVCPASERGWIEVFVGGGTTAVAAAVSAGLAVAALAQRVAPVGVAEVGERLGLPMLPSSEIVLHSALSDARSRGALRNLAAAFREHRAST